MVSALEGFHCNIFCVCVLPFVCNYSYLRYNYFPVIITCIVGAYYSVGIAINPPDGPYPIGSELNLTCSINPAPPDVKPTYEWRSSEPVYPVTPDDTVPIAKAHISGHSKQARYFCHVYSGSALLGVGSTVITVQGTCT